MTLVSAPLTRGAHGALVVAALVLASACSPTAVPLEATPAASRPGTGATSTAAASAVAATVAPTSAAGARACRPTAITPAQTEGPYYKANPPARANLVEAGSAGTSTLGTRFLLTGVVYGTDCQPIPGARVDFWQADASGAYDNTTYRFRGYQLTDASGAYRLETVIPGEYPGRTEHIHVKITPPGGSTLTSQLYFPDVARNNSDGIFDAKLLVQGFTRDGTGASAHFDFVVARR